MNTTTTTEAQRARSGAPLPADRVGSDSNVDERRKLPPLIFQLSLFVGRRKQCLW